MQKPSNIIFILSSAICPEPDFRAKELQQEVKNIEDGHKTLSDAKYQATVRRSPTKLNFGNPTADNFVLQKSEKATTEKHSVKHQKTRKDVSEAEEWSGLSNFSKKGGFDPNPSVVTCKYFPATATPRGYAYFKGKPPLRPFSRLGCYRAKTPMSKAPSSISTNAVQCEADRRVTVKLKKAEQSISAATMTKRSYSFAEFNRLNLKTNKQDQHTFLLKQMKEVQSKNNLRFVSFYKF